MMQGMRHLSKREKDVEANADKWREEYLEKMSENRKALSVRLGKFGQ
jgi:hypothetical protein